MNAKAAPRILPADIGDLTVEALAYMTPLKTVKLNDLKVMLVSELTDPEIEELARRLQQLAELEHDRADALRAYAKRKWPTPPKSV